MACASLSQHPEIICPHESLNNIRLGLVPSFEKLIEQLESDFPDKAIIGIHGQYEQIPKELYSMDYPKIILERKDQILAAVNQINLKLERPDKQFHLPVEQVLQVKRMREDNMDIMKALCGSFDSYYIEDLCPIDHTEFQSPYNEEIQKDIGVSNITRIPSWSVSKEAVPYNMEEIYAKANDRDS